jgi:hypothetical protein
VQIIDANLDAEMAAAFWGGCRNIKELVVMGSLFGGPQTTAPKFLGDRPRVLLKMERMTLALSRHTWPVDQDLVLKSCPNLRAVEIDSDVDGHIKFKNLTKRIQNGQLRHLEELNIGCSFTDIHMASCLQVLVRVTHLNIKKSFFRNQSFLSLARHFATLNQLHFTSISTFRRRDPNCSRVLPITHTHLGTQDRHIPYHGRETLRMSKPEVI